MPSIQSSISIRQGQSMQDGSGPGVETADRCAWLEILIMYMLYIYIYDICYDIMIYYMLHVISFRHLCTVYCIYSIYFIWHTVCYIIFIRGVHIYIYIYIYVDMYIVPGILHIIKCVFI